MKNKFGTEKCKEFLTEYVAKHPGCISGIFDDPEADLSTDNCFWLEPDFESLAMDPNNWKRRLKYKEGKCTVREFENRTYEYAVLATVTEDGSKFISVEFSAE